MVRPAHADEVGRVPLLHTPPGSTRRAGILHREPQATNLLPVVLEVAAGLRDGPVRVFGDGFDTPDGTGVRDYVHVTDLATRTSPLSTSWRPIAPREARTSPSTSAPAPATA